MRIFFVCVGALLWASCGHDPQSSDLSIRYGEEIDESQHPAVVFLGGCTGTFVSSTTLITAKHCVGYPDRAGRVREQVRLPRQGNVRSLKLFANPYGSRCCTRHDVAVAIFPEGTALATVPLHGQAVAAGDEVTMVGFGGRSGDRTAGPFGVKRFGSNAIHRLVNGMIETRMNPSGNSRSGLAPGDSGGPLFKDGEFVGVASSGDGRTWSHHVDITNPEAVRVLEIAVENGADIPGLN